MALLSPHHRPFDGTWSSCKNATAGKKTRKIDNFKFFTIFFFTPRSRQPPQKTHSLVFVSTPFFLRLFFCCAQWTAPTAESERIFDEKSPLKVCDGKKTQRSGRRWVEVVEAKVKRWQELTSTIKFAKNNAAHQRIVARKSHFPPLSLLRVFEFADSPRRRSTPPHSLIQSTLMAKKEKITKNFKIENNKKKISATSTCVHFPCWQRSNNINKELFGEHEILLISPVIGQCCVLPCTAMQKFN